MLDKVDQPLNDRLVFFAIFFAQLRGHFAVINGRASKRNSFQL